ncbi:MAG: hypothetical protein JEZ01_02645 [Labilibaculum sp.]|nr:hypothetical protein [Labilibaculum sp.]MBI9056649.1 hypothetical protein [Labilibaculum sp.]
MKKTLLLALLVGFAIFSKAQLNYINYHNELNQAKLLIAKANYVDALAIHLDVFKKYPKHFYRDVHNACVCAIRCEKFSNVNLLASELVLLGYKLEDFEQSAFDAFRNSDQWNSFCKTYPKLRKEYKAGFNDYLSKKYYCMFREDQKIALSSPKGNPISDQARWELSALLKLDYQSNGIPQFMHYKDPLFLQYYIMYRHYFGRINYLKNHPEIEGGKEILEKYRKIDFNKILISEIKKGNISPKTLVDAATYNANPYGKESLLNIDFENEKIYLSLNENFEERDQIEKNRLAIGMLTLEEEFGLEICGTWYSEYPFPQIKERIMSLDTNDKKLVFKIIGEEEAKTRKKYSNKLKKIFFLNAYENDKEINYLGL